MSDDIFNFNSDNDSDNSRAKKILKRLIDDDELRDKPKAVNYLQEIPRKSARDVLSWVQEHGSEEDKTDMYTHPLYIKGTEAGYELAEQKFKSELRALEVILKNMIDLK